MAATYLFSLDGWDYYRDIVGNGTASNGGYIVNRHETNGATYGNVLIYFKRQISVNPDTKIATLDYFVGYSLPTIMNNRAWGVTGYGLDEDLVYSSIKVSGTGNTNINPGFVYEFWQDQNDSSNVYTPYMLQSRHIITAPISSDGTVKVRFKPSIYYQYPYSSASGTVTQELTTYTSSYIDVITGVEAGTPPTINSTTFTEQNHDLSNYLGDGVFLKNASKIKYNVSYSLDSRVTLKHVRAICGDQVVEGVSGVIEYPTNSTIKIQVVDSDNQAAEQDYVLPIKDYINPTCEISCTEPTALGEATLSFKGVCYNDEVTNSWGTFNNKIQLRYAYREKDSSDWQWFTVDKTIGQPINNNNYNTSINITGLDYTEIYEFKAEISDNIQTVGSNTIWVRVMPVYDWSKEDFNINVPTTIEGMQFGKNVVLKNDVHLVLNPYDGYVGASDWIDLSTPLSKLPHGVVIVFGYMYGSTEHFQSFFIPKYFGQIDPNNGFLTQFSLFDRDGKYQIRGFKVFDDRIEASYIHPTLPVASDSMLTSGIDIFEIRYVIGV